MTNCLAARAQYRRASYVAQKSELLRTESFSSCFSLICSCQAAGSLHNLEIKGMRAQLLVNKSATQSIILPVLLATLLCHHVGLCRISRPRSLVGRVSIEARAVAGVQCSPKRIARIVRSSSRVGDFISLSSQKLHTYCRAFTDQSKTSHRPIPGDSGSYRNLQTGIGESPGKLHLSATNSSPL
jgi:hypothetical protein